MERGHSAHLTHTMRDAPPYLVQRQVEGGFWVRLARSSGMTEPSIPTNVVKWAKTDYVPNMAILSIDISPEEHQKLKAIASLKGQSIKDNVLGWALGDTPALDDMSQDETFKALANLLEPRLEQARRGQLSGKSVEDIRRDERKRAGV